MFFICTFVPKSVIGMRIKVNFLVVISLWCLTVYAQSEHHLYVNSQKKPMVSTSRSYKGEGVFATVNEALRQADSTMSSAMNAFTSGLGLGL